MIINLQDLSSLLTIVIPVRIDSEERRENLRAVLRHVDGLNCHIVVLEADTKPLLEKEDWMSRNTYSNLEYQFVEDNAQVFHRTRYINLLLSEAETEMVAVWDTDALVEYDQILEAAGYIIGGCTLAYPYNGEFVMLSEEESARVRKYFDAEYLKSRKLSSVTGRRFCGGIFLAHRQRYLECGGENEHFTGWGPEDAERMRRVSILGHGVRWTSEGQLYHLYHPRGSNSGYFKDEDATTMRKELVRVCSMDRGELEIYISSPNWRLP